MSPFLDDFLGKWKLVASAHERGEADLEDADSVAQWLEERPVFSPAQLEPDEGFILTIYEDASFQEQALSHPSAQYFDGEGVLLMDGDEPFIGLLLGEGPRLYPVLYSLSEGDTPRPRCDALLRYNDGDTIICDWFERVNEQLVRVQSVVTDELYFDRTTMVYERREP